MSILKNSTKITACGCKNKNKNNQNNQVQQIKTNGGKKKG